MKSVREEESNQLYVSLPPQSSLETEPIEKEPLIEEEETKDGLKTYWKGCEFLQASNLCSSKLSLQSTSSMCRICHISKSTRSNPLISPCRCSGSLLYVHKACVVRWLEMSTRKMVPAPRCELCGYDYRRSNIFQIRSLHIPHIDRNSCILNLLFLLSLLIMILCGYITIKFIQENASINKNFSGSGATYSPWKRRPYTTSVSGNDHGSDVNYHIRPPVSSLFDFKVISCASMFLSAFIVALFTQYRAEATVFRCIFRFFVINHNWMIKNYDLKNDPEMAIRRSLKASTSNSTSDPVLLQPSEIYPDNQII
ncbi:unnamed protein product [Caenorhabditis angaria]|uniref:RING-CH-type domain-containing protein n=1 Tax=Caenorhabditis angaria TaxID=860376 RepID=A0A9P1I804_9PELO|nr:unnamed protein product [Caenorhabditis angaria]